mmetsp:Transcript_95834/g.309102  ORF Transcript_95834/g.309102 Transcript_95834/m.309102 type:complete len:104 (+) Transcript_95834:342-653(+)
MRRRPVPPLQASVPGPVWVPLPVLAERRCGCDSCGGGGCGGGSIGGPPKRWATWPRQRHSPKHHRRWWPAAVAKRRLGGEGHEGRPVAVLVSMDGRAEPRVNW